MDGEKRSPDPGRELDPTEVQVVLADPPNRAELPQWHMRNEHGLELARARQTTTIGTNGEYQVYPEAVQWILGGDVEAYLREHGDCLWPVPETYRDFQNFPTYCGSMDGTLYRYGRGIDARQLERAFQVLIGAGHYNADDMTLIACGPQPWILAGPKGAVLAKAEPIDRPRLPSQWPRSVIETPEGQISVEEGNEHVLAGIRRLVSLLADGFDTTIIRHERAPQSDSDHIFMTKTGPLAVDAADLELLGTSHTDPKELPMYQTETTISPPVGDTNLVVSWDGPDVSVDVSEDSLVVGYQQHWRRHPDEFEAVVETYRLTLSTETTSEPGRAQLSTESDSLGWVQV